MPPSIAIVLYPFIAAFIYVFSALLIKRASEHGLGVWRSTFVTNLIAAAVFSSLWFLGGEAWDVQLIWQPAAIAGCLFLGQLCQFLALERGEVSVAVPVFGLKVVLVAFFTPWVIGDAVGLRLWIAAFLSVAGIFVLNRRSGGKPPRNIGITLVAGGLGAVCFAMFDVLVQKWGPHWGVGRLLPMIFWINAVFSLALIPMFKAPLRDIQPAAWKWLVSGSILLGVQSIIFVSTLSVYGKATAANVVYASRGLLSVALVWMIGHWFSNEEQFLGSRVLRWRMTGAAMMMAAIVTVIFH